MKNNQTINPDEFNTTVNSSSESKKTETVKVNDFKDIKYNNEILFDGNNVFYSLTEYEYKSIKNGVIDDWKTFLIATLSLFIPFLLNTFIEIKNISTDNFTWAFFINLLFTILFGSLSLIFNHFRKKTKNSLDKIFDDIEKKPRLKI